MNGLTLHDLATDVAHVIRGLNAAPAAILGATFGSRIARVVASDYRELVDAVILLGAGGRIPAPPIVREASIIAFDPERPRDERLKALSTAFFAKGNDPVAWEHGWSMGTVRMLLQADAATSVDDWWHSGGAPLLVIQGEEDIAAPTENGRLLKADARERVSLIEMPGAGHAMLAEQPTRIAARCCAFWQTAVA